jgi:hypothetical protein
MTKAIEDLIDRSKLTETKIEKFSDLLESLESTEDKKKLLWKEVYENAIVDRENANILFTDLLVETRGNSSNHAMFGQIMSKYIERMCKSNDQILKLAELISKEEKSIINPDDIFDEIGG